MDAIPSLSNNLRIMIFIFKFVCLFAEMVLTNQWCNKGALIDSRHINDLKTAYSIACYRPDEKDIICQSLPSLLTGSIILRGPILRSCCNALFPMWMPFPAYQTTLE